MCLNLGIIRPIANRISNKPVKLTNVSLYGMNLGIIKVIPFVKIKCPVAVNTNIIDIAILPDRAKSYSLFIIFMTQKKIL